MTWSAIVGPYRKDGTNGNILATVTFHDDTGDVADYAVDIPFSDQVGLDNIIALQLKVRTNRDALFPTLVTGPFTGRERDPDPLLVALQTVALMDQKIKLGVKTVLDADYVAALDLAKTLQSQADADKA